MTITITKSPRDSIITRYNQCTAPIGDGYAQPTGWTNNWFGAGGAGTNQVSTGELDKTWTTRPTSVADTGWYYTDTSWPAGGWRHVLARIFCNGFNGKAMIRCTFLSSSGATLSTISSTPTNLTASFWVAFEGVFQSPAGTDHVKIEVVLVDNGNIPNVGNGIALSHVLIEDGNVLGTSRYFDGNTAAAGSGTTKTTWEGTAGSSRSIYWDWDPANVMSPQLVEGWDQLNPGRNTYFELLDDTFAVVLRSAGARRGTLKLLFGGLGIPAATAQAAAVKAAQQHVKLGSFIYTDTALGGLASLTYALDGDVRLYPTDSRQAWRLDVPFREL